MKCELCQRVVTQDEAQFADSIKPNTGMTLCPECAQHLMTMNATEKSLNIQISTESLGDMSADVFEKLFRAELERSFPGVYVNIEYGMNARIDHDGFDEDPTETVHNCSEDAFKATIKESN